MAFPGRPAHPCEAPHCPWAPCKPFPTSGCAPPLQQEGAIPTHPWEAPHCCRGDTLAPPSLRTALLMWHVQQALSSHRKGNSITASTSHTCPHSGSSPLPQSTRESPEHVQRAPPPWQAPASHTRSRETPLYHGATRPSLPRLGKCSAATACPRKPHPEAGNAPPPRCTPGSPTQTHEVPYTVE